MNINEHYQTWAQKLVHTVHKADEAQKGPFKDDAEYRLYLFNVKRELFSFFVETQKLMKQEVTPQ